MRLRSARARGAGANRQQNHGLAGAPRAVGTGGEAATIAEVLDVDRDEAGRFVLDKVLDAFGGIEVGLVSERDKTGEADRGIAGALGELEAHVAALRNQPHRSGAEVVPCQVEAGGQIGDAEAIGPNQDGPGLPAARNGLILDGTTSLMELAQAGRDRDDRAGAGTDRVFDRGGKAGRPDGDDDQLGRLR
jgi:hypothetical protein